MKRLISFLLAALMVFSLAACGSREDNEDGAQSYEYKTGYDDQPFFVTRSAMNVSNGEGVYFFIPAYEQLYYYDSASKKTVVVCSKPDCEHLDYEPQESENDCNAFFNSSEFYYGNGYAYYDDSLYMLGRGGKDKYTVSLFKVSKDGAKREEVCEIFSTSDVNNIGEFALHRGYAFCTVRSSDNESLLYSVNLNDNNKVECVYTLKGNAAYISRMSGAGKYMYFQTAYAEDEEYENWSGMIYRFDLETGECEETVEYIKSFALIDGNLYYIKENKICRFDADKKKESEIADCPEGANQLSSDGKYLYLTNIEDEEAKKGNKIFVMTPQGEMKDEIPKSNMQFFEGGDSSYMFIEAGDGGTEVFDKSQLGTPEQNWQKLYSHDENGKLILYN